jgi:hypothetical protein
VDSLYEEEQHIIFFWLGNSRYNKYCSPKIYEPIRAV